VPPELQSAAARASAPEAKEEIEEPVVIRPPSLYDAQARLNYAVRLSMLPQPDSKDPHQENLLDQTVWLSKCISLFREKLDLLEVKGTVSTQDSFAESLRQLRIEFRMFVTSPDARRLADLIENEISAEEARDRAAASQSNTRDARSFDSEMVQQQEKQKEKQKQKEQQKQKQTQFGLNTAKPMTWKLSCLSDSKDLVPKVFYPLASFSVSKHEQPIPFPSSVLLSENYAPQLWRTDLGRRLKNVNVILEWKPAMTKGTTFERQAEQADVNWLNRAYEKHALTANEIAERKSTETRHIKPPPAKFTVALSLEEAESLRRALHLAQSKASQPLWMGSQLGLLTKDGLRLVASDDTSRQQQFQRLQEIKEQTAEKEPNSEDEDAQDAEDERLAMELSTRQAAADRKRQRDDEHLATVNRLAADFKRLGHNEKAVAYAEALAGQMMTIRALKECIEDDWAIGRQLLRFFDNVLWITQSDAVLILRALASIPESHRRLFFEQVMGCRRRDRVSWKDTGVEKIFAHSDDAALLKLSDWALRVSVGIATKYESMREAFKKFDSDNDNWLSLADLSAEISRMNLGLAAAEIQQLVEHVDMDKDGFLDFRSFAQAFAPKHNDFDSLLDGRKSSAKVTGTKQTTSSLAFFEGNWVKQLEGSSQRSTRACR